MAERTVKVNLIAQVSGYVDGMDRAARATRTVGSEAERLAQKRQAFESLGRPILAIGVLAAAGVAIAIKKFADFDAAISNVQAVTQATTEDMGLLRDAALDAGGRTVYTAIEAANALEELGKASFSTQTSIEALDGTLALAASGQLEVARAAEITATTLKQFGLDATDAGHVADVLSAGAGKALGSVEDLAQGLKFVGPVAASMGISLEETTGALALFADQGLIGEQAGTSLRGVLSSLTSPSAEAAKKIKDLGIELYDLKTNKFLGVQNLAGELSDAFSTLDDKSRDAALGVIFGNQQVTAARVLFGAGASKVREYTDSVNDSGYASKVAADRLNNLNGDLEKLGGAFDTVLIKQGSAANDSLRELVQGVTFLVEAAGDLPDPVLEGSLAVGAIAAAMAIAGGAALLAIPKFVAVKEAFAVLDISAKSASISIGLAGAAIGVAALVVGEFVAISADSKATVNSLVDSLDDATGAYTNYSREIIANKFVADGSADTARRLGISLKTLTDAAFGLPGPMREVEAAMNAGRVAGEVNGRAIDSLGTYFGRLQGDVAKAPKEWERLQSVTEDNSDALGALEGRAASAGVEISGLADIIRGFGSATLSTRDAERDFQAAIDDATEALVENGTTTDINTAAGRANQAALDDIAKSAFDVSAAILEETGSHEAATAAIQAGRDAVIAQRIAMGDTQEQAETYADSLGLIPANVNTAANLDTGPADNALAKLKSSFKAFESSGLNLVAYMRTVDGRATGGLITGPGSGTSDTAGIYALSNGEFVSTARTTAVPANRAALEYMHRGGVIHGYAGGGYVQTSSRSDAGPAAFNVIVTSKGGIDLLEYVDVRVEARDAADLQTTRGRSIR